MSPKAMLATLLSLTFASQFAYAIEAGKTHTTVKINYSAPAMHKMKPQTNTPIQPSQKGETQTLAVAHLVPFESGSNGMGLTPPDSNEQFTRMSCCP